MIAQQLYHRFRAALTRRRKKRSIAFLPVLLLLIAGFTAGICTQVLIVHTRAGRPGALLPRSGDEIVVCGQLFHTGAPVVLWMDPGGYDAYRVERRFVPWDKAGYAASRAELPTLLSPERYGPRKDVLTPAEFERVRGGGWDLPLLQRVVDQLVLHYDVSGTSRQCFATLQDRRGLSVHFMIDLDGTIYQTLDLKERAWHATTSNSRSIGIEIANVGSYADGEKDPFAQWYARDAHGLTYITIPAALGDGGERTPHFVGRPSRNDLVFGEIQSTHRRMYDFTPQQYDSLIHLTAAICRIFPRIRCDCPRDEHGQPLTYKLPDAMLKNYHGILGHYHLQLDKTDPGPAMQWDRVIDGARKLGHLNVKDQSLPLPTQQVAERPAAPPATLMKPAAPTSGNSTPPAPAAAHPRGPRSR